MRILVFVMIMLISACASNTPGIYGGTAAKQVGQLFTKTWMQIPTISCRMAIGAGRTVSQCAR